VLNTDNFWAPLIGLINHFIAEGFADPSLLDLIQVVDDVAALEAGLAAALS
jgi:predicted Rossmann-fold nucleotide-binding protein